MLRHCSLSFAVGEVQMKKEEAIKIIHTSAQKYREYLVGKTTLILFFKDRSTIGSIEISFMASNFLHLTGLKVTNSHLDPNTFYLKCLDSKLSKADFEFSPDGTTELKLKVLSSVLTPNLSAKMIGDFSSNNIRLYTEKLIGGTKACIGFIKSDKGIYYPNTLLNVDIRDIVRRPMRVLAVFQKRFAEQKYIQKTYQAKDVNKADLYFNSDIKYLKDFLN